MVMTSPLGPLMAMLTSALCYLEALTSPPDLLATLLRMQSLAPSFFVMFASPPALLVTLTSATRLLATLTLASGHLRMSSWMIPRLWPSLHLMLRLLSASASRLNKIGPRARLVYVRQPR